MEKVKPGIIEGNLSDEWTSFFIHRFKEVRKNSPFILHFVGSSHVADRTKVIRVSYFVSFIFPDKLRLLNIAKVLAIQVSGLHPFI